MPVPSPVTTTAPATFGGSSLLPRPGRTPTFDEHNENLHRIEFEAPLSAGAQPLTQGRFSIDFSLELERQLAMESPPVTPAHDATAHGDGNGQIAKEGHNANGSAIINHLHDPDILAHFVTQLRQSLADMTKERDELVKMLATANSEEASAKNALGLMTEKVTEAEDELVEARKKIREDEDQIVLLRAKVEESRRGLMRLQTESRRQSMAPIDVSRASSLSLGGFGSPPSSKRASFTPLTGSGHRRISSVSDTNTLAVLSSPDLNPSPNYAQGFGLTSPGEANLSGAPSSSRRFSGLFGHGARQSPPENDLLQATAAAEAQASNAAELEVLKTEVKTLKDELDTVKHDLIEATEAREASETCVKALREFIAENNIGATSVKLPPPPTMATGEETSSDPKKTSTGWGFKLWGSGSGSGSGGAVDSPPRTSMGSSAPYSAGVAGSNAAPGTPMAGPPTATIGAAPLSRKFGLFSSRSSISSNTSREQSSPALPPLQMNAPHLSQRDSVYSYSDASSVAEPVSPGSDVHGLGTSGYGGAHGGGPGQMEVHAEVEEGKEDQAMMVVWDVTNLNRGHHAAEMDDLKKGAITPVSLPEVDMNGLR